MYKSLSAPLVVQVELTERCPNQCLHCYNYWRHGGDSLSSIATLSLQQIDRIMSELERSKVFEIVITGGEPFLNKAGLFHQDIELPWSAVCNRNGRAKKDSFYPCQNICWQLLERK